MEGCTPDPLKVSTSLATWGFMTNQWHASGSNSSITTNIRIKQLYASAQASVAWASLAWKTTPSCRGESTSSANSCGLLMHSRSCVFAPGGTCALNSEFLNILEETSLLPCLREHYEALGGWGKLSLLSGAVSRAWENEACFPGALGIAPVGL